MLNIIKKKKRKPIRTYHYVITRKNIFSKKKYQKHDEQLQKKKREKNQTLKYRLAKKKLKLEKKFTKKFTYFRIK